MFVRGDLNGELHLDAAMGRYRGFFEYPAEGDEHGSYQIIVRDGALRVSHVISAGRHPGSVLRRVRGS